MAEPTTKVIAYALFVVSFLVMLYYILRQARDNRKIAIDDFGPNIAGSVLCGWGIQAESLRVRRDGLCRSAFHISIAAVIKPVRAWTRHILLFVDQVTPSVSIDAYNVL